MSRIQLNDNIMEAMGKISDGNPGAITVLLQLHAQAGKIDPQDFMGGLGPVLALDTHQIYGDAIWRLYKDVCDQELVNVCAVLRSCQLGILPERDLKRAIDGDLKLDVADLLKQVMDRLDEFNRQPKEEAPDVPPSYFMKQGIPACSMWGKTEIECLAWAYVAAMALDGDTWREMTPQQCLEAVSQDDNAKMWCGYELRSVIEGNDHAVGWWKDVTSQLTDAAGAFKVGGLAWNRRRYDREPQPA